LADLLRGTDDSSGRLSCRPTPACKCIRESNPPIDLVISARFHARAISIARFNPSTNYQSGIDWHLDWGASQFLTKQIQVGAVGYFYEQITPDSGAGDRLGAFESGVIGVGPQVGFIIPAGSLQAYINVKAYWEFDGHDRPSGWNTWLTLSLSPAPPSNPRSAMLTK
jgi:hypothetical protein